MAECEWAILCDYSFRDQGGKVCMIGVFDKILTNAVPATHHQAAMVLRFVGEPKEKINFRLEIIRPTGGLLGKLEGGGELGETGTAEINLNLGSLPIPDLGTYAFQLYLNDQMSKATTFVVAKPPQ